MGYSKTYEIIWADIDANRHLRHSAYNDYAAQVRVSFFKDFGFSVEKLAKLMIGPILFSEYTKFLREVGMNDSITGDIKVASMRKDASRWKIVHQIFRSDGVLSAVITVEGAWMDLNTRKLTIPPPEIRDMIEHMPKTDDFEFAPDKKAD